MSENDQSKSRIDRTTRLLITITFFGGAWFIFKNISLLWFNTFTKNAYTVNIINIEHIFAIVSLTIILLIISYVFRYIYFEFKTYQNFDGDNEKEKAILDADNSFKEIFKLLNYVINTILVLFLIRVIIEVINEPFILSYILGGLIFFIVLIVLLKRINKEKVKKIFEFANVIEDRTKHYGIIGYIALFVVLFGISLTLVSLGEGKNVRLELLESSNVMLKIELQNFRDPEIYLFLFNELTEEKSMLKVDQSEFLQSFVEVKEINEKYDLQNILSDTQNTLLGIDKFYINKSNYQHYAEKELAELLTEGKNQLRVIIMSNDNSKRKIVDISTNISKYGNEYQISQKKFELQP